MRPDTAPASRPVAGTAAMVRTRGGRAIGQPRLATKRTKTRNPRNPLLTERFSCVQCFGVSWRRVDGLWMLKFLPAARVAPRQFLRSSPAARGRRVLPAAAAVQAIRALRQEGLGC